MEALGKQRAVGACGVRRARGPLARVNAWVYWGLAVYANRRTSVGLAYGTSAGMSGLMGRAADV